MNILQAAILGLVQGLGEFLPIYVYSGINPGMLGGLEFLCRMGIGGGHSGNELCSECPGSRI